MRLVLTWASTLLQRVGLGPTRRSLVDDCVGRTVSGIFKFTIRVITIVSVVDLCLLCLGLAEAITLYILSKLIALSVRAGLGILSLSFVDEAASRRSSLVNLGGWGSMAHLLELFLWRVAIVTRVDNLFFWLGLTPRVANDIFSKRFASIIGTRTDGICIRAAVSTVTLCAANQG